MKKSIQKTLQLSKETLRALNRSDLEVVLGGFGNATVGTRGYANTCGACNDSGGCGVHDKG